MSKNENEVEATEEVKGPRMAKRVNGVAQDAALTVLATENPKRPNSASHARFQAYLDEQPETVAKAISFGLTMGDIKYDIIHGSIEVEGAEVEEYEVAPRGPRSETSDEAGDVEADDEDIL